MTALAIVDQDHAAELDAARVDAQGTMWRLRSLVALGHSTPRIGWALGIGTGHVERIISGGGATVPAGLQEAARRLSGAWWDKVPPEDTPAQKLSAQRARKRAKRAGWCCPLGLDERYIDTPRSVACYVNWEPWRRAWGAGTASPDPLHLHYQGVAL